MNGELPLASKAPQYGPFKASVQCIPFIPFGQGIQLFSSYGCLCRGPELIRSTCGQQAGFDIP
jgi:hypothetical protein